MRQDTAKLLQVFSKDISANNFTDVGLPFKDGPTSKIRELEDKPMKYVCPCGYEYDPAVGDPDNGIAPGTAFENLPEDFTCPICGLGKEDFTAEE